MVQDIKCIKLRKLWRKILLNMPLVLAYFLLWCPWCLPSVNLNMRTHISFTRCTFVNYLVILLINNSVFGSEISYYGMSQSQGILATLAVELFISIESTLVCQQSRTNIRILFCFLYVRLNGLSRSIYSIGF